jgi:hypothetical protein
MSTHPEEELHGPLRPCEIYPGEFDHDWRYHSDWGGDPGVINGTFDCSYWRCEQCDETKGGGPPEYDDYEGY